MNAPRSYRHSTLKSALPLVAVFFLLLATLGIPLSQHWCRGEVLSSVLYSQAASCGMPEESSAGSAFQTPPCCASTNTLQAADHLENDGPLVTSFELPAAIAVWLSRASIYGTPPVRLALPAYASSPPPRPRDWITLTHSYLI